ncbi:MAG: uracil-DNA glycosylase [Candidatus Verstraetearchaeota archaeon]|nr:uracil-DNA glycosylase [Candidatus Verstraetearchaeota archaeon]
MKISEKIACTDLPCQDIEKKAYRVPEIDIDPLNVRVMMVSEAAPQEASDYYYSEGEPLFEKTTVQAFRDAGLEVVRIWQLVDRGFYFTTAVKCGKTGYGIETATVKECSFILEKELDLFPNLRVVMLMGDVAIKAFNEVAKRKTGTRVIPAGSTYKIRKTPYHFKGIRVFPSYLQAGPSFFIEKSKRKMIAEDITESLKMLK